nr:MAG TPA: hypothetical protein [Caudoviricetes sp.]
MPPEWGGGLPAFQQEPGKGRPGAASYGHSFSRRFS